MGNKQTVTESKNDGVVSVTVKDRARYTFADDSGRSSAVLDFPDGKLAIKDEAGSLETFPNWKDYVIQVLGEKPVKGEMGEILAQLSPALGTPTLLIDSLSAAQRKVLEKHAKDAARPKTVAKKDASTKDAPAKKAPAKVSAKVPAARKTPAKKTPKTPAAKKPSTLGELPLCTCGCESTVARADRLWLQGHDARGKGRILKVERGKLKMSDLAPILATYARSVGVKGAKKAE